MKKLIGHIRWFALVGLGISIYLLILHLNYDKLGTTCDIGSVFSCSVLLIKEYSQWFGIPVPIFSILLYLVALGLAGYAYKEDERQVLKPYLYLYSLSLISLAASIGMAFIAFVKLKTICIFCTGLYIVSILFFVWMRKIKKLDDRDWTDHLIDEFREIAKNTAALKIIAAVGFALVGSYFYFQSQQIQVSFDHERALIGRSVGNPDAEVKVEVFSDFQCPACKNTVPFLYLLEKELSKEIHLTYKFYPLDSACNPNMRRAMHPQACKAARAAFCASLQNKFWRYHDFLFQNQMKLHDDIYQEIAQREGMKIGEFLQCMESEDARNAIQADISLGNMYSVTATPTIMVNGKPFTQKRTIEEFKKFIHEVR